MSENMLLSLWDTTLYVFGALGLLYLYLTWTFNYWTKRNVPQHSPNILFGSLTESALIKKSYGEVLRDIYRKFDGYSFVGIYKFREPALLIRDAELAKAILMKDFHYFDVNNFPIDENLDPLFSRSPFFQYGEKWKKTRSQLSPAFTSGKIKPLLPLMVGTGKKLNAFLTKEMTYSEKDGIETKEVAAKYTTENVAQCIFGIDGGSFEDPNAKLRNLTKKIIEPGVWMSIKFMIMSFFPLLSSLIKIRWISTELDEFFRNMTKDVIKHREENNIVRNDYLEMLLQLKRKGKVHEEGDDKITSGAVADYTDDDLMAHALTFFTEGFETSAITFTFILYELALNEEVQRKLITEIDSVLNKNKGEITFDGIQEMKYLDMVLQETLRLHPPAMALEKKCTKPYEVTGNNGQPLIIEKDTSIVIPLYAYQTDEKYFPQANLFYPDRFEDESNINKAAYLPFGLGPRICIGMRFAQTQVKAGVVSILSEFEIKKSPKTTDPFVQDPAAPLTAVKGGAWLRFIKRVK